MNGRIVLTISIAFCMASSGGVFAQAISPDAEEVGNEATILVQKAARADEHGNSELRAALLSQALEIDSENELAHWHRGQVRFDREWKSTDEVDRLVSNDRRWKEYRRLVAASNASADSQAALARWCRRSELENEERWHWLKVLKAEPDHVESLRRLGLERYQGGLYTKSQVAQMKKAKQELRQNKSKVERLVRAAERRDATERKAALAELAAVADPAAIPALTEAVQIGYSDKRRLIRKLGESEVTQYIPQLHEAAVMALANMDAHEATVKLVEVAVLSPYPDVRRRAAEALISRPKTDYMPLLISGLTAPLKLTVSTDIAPDGAVIVKEELYEEGQEEDVSTVRTSDYLTSTRFEFGRTSRAWMNNDTNRDLWKADSHVQRTESWVARQNESRQRRNEKIQEVLAIVTGQDFGSDVNKWWQMWKDYNEFDYPSEKPVRNNREYYSFHETEQPYEPADYQTVYDAPRPYDSSRSRPRRTSSGGAVLYPTGDSRLGPLYGSADPHPVVTEQRRRRSCFAAGTPVWTQSGPRPIEQIQAGDLVLSQDPISGRLDYRPVLQTTVRSPSPVVNVTIDSETITATLGHRFWVTGIGWRMAKHLDSGYRLFGLNGSTKVNSIEAGTDVEAFNLHVDEFHTYFVGNGQLLVHDNSLPQPTTNVVPGVPLSAGD